MNRLDAAKGFERLGHRPPAPVSTFGGNRLLEPLDSGGGFVDGLHVFLEGDLLRRGRQFEVRDPAPMRLRPGALARVADVVSQQQRGKPLARLALHDDRVFARAHEIAHRLIGRIGHVDRGELARAR